MKLTCCIVLAIGALLAGPACAATLPECTSSQLSGYRPGDAAIKTHRTFKLPTLSYPNGTHLPGLWGLDLTLRVDATGHIVCQQLRQDEGSDPAIPNPRRRALLANLSHWQYTPFMHDHHAVAAIVIEHIAERELPAKYQPLPDVPLKDVHITLTRSACFGTCPVYRIDVYGDGRIVYDGKKFTAVHGQHTYQTSTRSVAALVEQARKLDIWSMDPSYQAPVTDLPGSSLTLTFGQQRHHIEDYAGQMVGMPKAVIQFENAIDRLLHAAQQAAP